MLYEGMPTFDENEGNATLGETSAALNEIKNMSAPDYDGITT